MSTRRSAANADTNADAWGAGLRFSGKTLSTKTVKRATKPLDVIAVCLAHNLRDGNADHRHRSRIDASKTPLNNILHGPASAVVANELAMNILYEFSITPSRCDAIMGVELVFQPPPGADTPAFWTACMDWVNPRYRHVISAVVHRDQQRPHIHVLALAVEAGGLAGNSLTAGANRFTNQRRAFLAHMRSTLGLRPDRPVKCLTDLALSTGRGPKSRAEADRRDAALVRRGDSDLRRNALGMGVDGHGGSPVNSCDPHAHAKPLTPLLRSDSPLAGVFKLWAELVPPQGPVPSVMSPCPLPRSAGRPLRARLCFCGGGGGQGPALGHAHGYQDQRG